MPDGETLLADRWFAPASVASAPIVLLRSPYGRRRLGFVGRLFAERGYQAVIQSCRGTFGSGGRFDPFHHEAVDGTATLEWLSWQPWFTGAIGTFGPSYLGLTQWSVAANAPGFVQAMALSITASRFREGVVYPGESFSLETGAAWFEFVGLQERCFWRRQVARATFPKRFRAACDCLPIRCADRVALGHEIAFYQDWLTHERRDDPWWAPLDFSCDMSAVPPASLVAGWFDMFLGEQVQDYLRLRQAGREARLTIGPWTHRNSTVGAAALRDALDWFDVHLRSRPPPPAAPRVRLYVMGSDRWVDLPDWPPVSTDRRWYLHPAGRLSPHPAAPGPPDGYCYDPADPTPGVGGASLNRRNAGSRDQGPRERRADVLCYTSDPCRSDVTVAGELRRQSVAADQPASRGRVPAPVRRGALRALPQHQRWDRQDRSGADAGRSGRDEVRWRQPGSHRHDVPPGASHPGAGIERRSPAHRPQHGEWRAAGDGGQAGRYGRTGVSRSAPSVHGRAAGQPHLRERTGMDG